MSSFDAGRIVATADVDRTPFQQGLRLLKQEARDFADKKITATADVDTKPGEAKIVDFKQRLESVDRTRAQARIALDNGEATRKLITFQERLDQMRTKVATARVDADTDVARRRLDELDIQLRKVGLITARPRVNLEGVERANLQLDALGLKLAAVGSGGGAGGGRRVGSGGGGGFLSRLPNPGMLGLTLAAAVPATVPFAGLAGGIAGGALSAGVSGGLGLGAFGLAAKSNVTTITGDITKLTKLTAQYNAATTDKQRAAALAKEQTLWKGLDPAQRAAVKNVQSLDSAWTSYKKKLEPQTFAVVADGAKIASTGLKYLLPTAQAVGDEIDLLAKRAEHAFKAPFWHQFFGDFLPGEAARSVDALGTTLGHVGTGVAHLVQDFAPLAHLLEGGSDSLSARFEKWTEGAGPGKFVAWVEKEGPIAAQALEALASGLLGLGKGLAPIGNIELKALTPILNFLGKLGDEHPEVITALGAAYLSVAGGLKAIAAVRGLAGVAGILTGGRLGGGGGGGGIFGKIGKAAPVPVYVTNWGGGEVPGVPGGLKKPGTLKRILGDTEHFGPYAAAARPALALAGDAALPLALAGGVAYTLATTRNPKGYDPKQLASDSRLVQTDPAVGQRYKELLAEYQKTHPASSLTGGLADTQQQQLIAQAAREVKNLGSVSSHSANDIDTMKSSLARLRSELSLLPAAETRAFAQLQSLPSYLATAEQAAQAGGFAIGRDLKQGIIVGIQQTHGTVDLVNIHQTVNGRTVVRNVKAQLAGGGPAAAGSTYLVGEKGPELFTPHAAGTVHSTNSTFGLLGKQLAQALALNFAGFSSAFEKLFGKALDGQVNRLGTRLNNAANQYRSDLAARAQLGSQISTGLQGSASIANANLSNTGGATVGGYLGDQLQQLKQFATVIKQLRKKRLDPRLLQQIIDAGPQQGLQLAQEILSGESISGLNSQERQIAGSANAIGSTVASATFAKTLSHDAASMAKVVNAIDRLAARGLHLTPAERNALAREIGREIHRAFPSLNIRELGRAGAIRIYAS